MKLRLAQPEVLVDINGLTELSYIRIEGGALRIGAMTRHADLLASAVAGEQFAIFHDAERVIADPVVRNWGHRRRLAVPGGSIGGSVRGLRRGERDRGNPGPGRHQGSSGA